MLNESRDLSKTTKKERCLISEVVYLRDMLDVLMEEKADIDRLRQQVRDADEIITTYGGTIKSLMQEILELRKSAASSQDLASLQGHLIASESRRIREVMHLQAIIHEKDKEIAALQIKLADHQKGGAD